MSAQPLDDARAARLGEEWISAWNSHDLDAIMALYSPDVLFQTPTAIASLGIPNGLISGAERLREHFRRGLSACPTSTSTSSACTRA